MDLDLILQELGEFGTYQKTIYFLLFFPLVFSSMGSLSYVFTVGDVEYRCNIPECETNITSFEKPWLSDALPYKNGKLINNCKRYQSNNNNYHENCTSDLFIKTKIEDCHTFVFKNSENTITKEFNLLCDENKWKRTLVGTLNNVGLFIGLPLAGILSDRYGRKNVVVTAVAASAAVATLRSFSMNYIQFVILEVLDAVLSSGTYVGIFILGIEVTGPKRRSLGGVILSSYFTVGVVILGLVVWIIDDWRIYLRIISLPGLLVACYYWILPESLRWLITNEKKDEVFETLKKLSEKNKKPLSDNIKKAIEELDKTESMNMDTKSGSDKEVKVYPMKEIFKTRVMLLRFLNCSYCWITNTFVFYGLSLSSVVIAGNKYFNFILVSFIEIPAYIITWLAIDAFGRKVSLSMSLVISGISCTMFHFIDADMQTVRLLLFLMGKCAITVSFTALYVCASEMFPTKIRNSLMGFCSTLGRFGSMIAPQMPLLAAYVDPVLIFGAASFVSGALALYFPETLNCKMPDTIEEAEMLGKEKTKESS